MNWFYIDGGKQIGPITEKDLGRLIEAGILTQSSLVRREDSEDWTRIIESGLVEVKAESLSDTQPPKKTKVHEAVEFSRHMKICIVLSLISFAVGFGLALLLSNRYEFKIVPFSVGQNTLHAQYRTDNFTGRMWVLDNDNIWSLCEEKRNE